MQEVTIQVLVDTEYRIQNEGTSLEAVISGQWLVVFTAHSTFPCYSEFWLLTVGLPE